VGLVPVAAAAAAVTGKLSPNDVDVIILPTEDLPEEVKSTDELSWPFLQIIIAADDADLERWAIEDFGTDRRRRAKGVIEVVL
jgi:hypothetical protein